MMDARQTLVYTDLMGNTVEFTMTEDSLRAVLETMTNMNAALLQMGREMEAANEAIVILNARLDLADAAIEYVGGPSLSTIGRRG